MKASDKGITQRRKGAKEEKDKGSWNESHKLKEDEVVMPIMFNTILEASGFRPPSDVRLLRHKDNTAERGKTPYDLWRHEPKNFDLYQQTQSVGNRRKLAAPFWAVFIGTPANETLFIGMYRAEYRGVLKKDQKMPHKDGVDKAGSCDVYSLLEDERLRDLSGRLVVEWGLAYKTWIQRADKQNKPIRELRTEFKEPDFPGFMDFRQPLSTLRELWGGWISVLKQSKGVYLLTCPRTNEQYVGSASGEEGLWGRWKQYYQDGHGGNVGLKSRIPSDYEVSILEVAGSSATNDDVLRMESRWKEKLKSREMGLCRN